MVLGKMDRYVQKNKTRPPTYTTHKNKFKKWIKDLNVTLKTTKSLEEKIVKSWTFLVATFFLMYLLRLRIQKKK